MIRYFFDIKIKTSVKHDFIGQLLSTPEQARELADMMATDLICTRPNDVPNMEVEIRSSDGTLISSVPTNTKSLNA